VDVAEDWLSRVREALTLSAELHIARQKKKQQQKTAGYTPTEDEEEEEEEAADALRLVKYFVHVYFLRSFIV
jgi:hypothetical protein